MINLKKRHFEVKSSLSMSWCDGSLSFLQTKIECIKQAKEAEAESMLRTQFKMELIIYTQDSMYSNTLSMMKLEDEEETMQSHGIPRISVCSLYNQSDNRATLDELMRHLKSYYSVSILYLTSYFI